MAAPSYTEDLTDIDLAQVVTNYVQINHAGGGGGTLGVGADFSMQGNLCIDRQVTNNNRGIAFNNGAGINVTGTDVHVFQWLYNATSGISDTLQNEGASVFAGNATGQLVRFHVEGSDTYGAGGRVARCYPYRYVTTASGSVPYRTLTGSPSGNPQYFGGGINMTATVKGANLGIDAMRYGTGAYLTAGELISDGDASDAPCTFDGFSTQNDLVANRWGILTKIGSTYELQGKFVIGQDSSKVATLCKFEDSDVSVFIPDTPHSLTDFTQIIVDHASSIVNLTNFNFEALGTNNVGQFNVNNASTAVTITGGTWTSIGVTSLEAATTVDGLVWRQCGAITLNGASVDDALIDRSSSSTAMICDDLDLITNCNFIGDSTGYAVDMPTLITVDRTDVWDNTFDSTTYAVSDGSTGNEVIRCNVDTGITLTISVAVGASTPTIHNTGAGTVDVVVAPVTIGVTVIDTDSVAIQNARVQIVATETVGTITAGDVLLTGLTDVNGVLEDTAFVYESAFDPTGLDISIKARQGTSIPYKKPSATVGTIVAGTGFSSVIALQSDE